MATTDKVECYLLDTDLTTVLCNLPASEAHLLFEINEPGSGDIKIPLDSSAASSVTSGRFVECFYRGSARGGFFVENIRKIEIESGENEGRFLSASGRGALVLLDDAIVWDDGTNETTRTFIAQSKAAILNTLLTEAQARGGLANLTWDFTGSVDSSSDAWTDSEDYKLNVGDSLLDIARGFSKTGGFDFEINLSGGSFVLSAYKAGIGTDVSSTIYFRSGSNCQELSSEERGDNIRNVYKVKYKDGYTVASDGTSITNRRRRELLLNAEVAQTPASALTYASAKLDETKNPPVSISIKVFDGRKPNIFLDYNMGDTITYDVKGTETARRILGMQLSFENEDFANITVELNNLFYDNNLKRNGDLDWLLSQWNTAKDAGLAETSFWAALGASDEITDIKYYNGNIYVSGLGQIGQSGNFYVAYYNIESGLWYPMAGLTQGIYAIEILDGYIWSVYQDGSDIFFYRWSGSAWVFYTNFGSTATLIGAQMIDGGDGNIYMAGDIELPGDEHRILWTNDTTAGEFYFVEASVDSLPTVAIFNGKVYVGASGASMTTSGLLYSNGISTGDDPLTEVSITELAGASVHRIEVFNDLLVIAYDGGSGDIIATWDGVSSSLVTIGTLGAGETISEMTVYLSDLYIGGNFETINGVTGYGSIAKYNAGGWSFLGTQGAAGVNGQANAILFNDSNVYVGGVATQAGGSVAVDNLAIYFTSLQNALDYSTKNGGSFDMGAAIHNATAAAITDSGEVPFWDAVSTGLRKITWANIKATLKTYFDTLYGTASSITTDTSNFNGNLSSADDTVQKALNTLDDMAVGGGGVSENYLINGGFPYAQRQVPTTLTTIATDKYSADRFRISVENASLQFQQADATGETGLTSNNYGTFKKITNTGKFAVYQIIEGVNSVPLRGKTIIFQAKMKASASKTIRMAILELQNAGTIDTIPATFVSAYNGNTTDPTFGTNVAIITGAQSKSVTTSWQSFSVSVTVPSNSKNIICAVWSDSQFAANDTLSMAECGLFEGSTVVDWLPKRIEDEYISCLRYYEKSYELETAIGTNTGTGVVGNTSPGTKYVFGFPFSAPKRIAPTMSLYSQSGTANKVTVWTTGLDIGTSVTAQAITRNRVGYIGDSGTPFTVGAGYDWHYTAECEL